MITKTVTIDFENHTIREERNDKKSRAGASVKAGMARDILVAAVQAIRNDPSILAIVDEPGSKAAGKALEKLGIVEHAEYALNDDVDIEDIL